MPEFEEDTPLILTLAMAVAWVLMIAVIAAATGCTPAQLSQVQDASQKREVICDFVEVWAESMPELEKPRELCRAGAELKEVAAAYAGCPAGKAEQ